MTERVQQANTKLAKAQDDFAIYLEQQAKGRVRVDRTEELKEAVLTAKRELDQAIAADQRQPTQESEE